MILSPQTSHLSAEVVRVTLAELHKSRNDLHRSHLVSWCDMKLAMPGLSTGRAVRSALFELTGECVCRDLVVDVLQVVCEFLTEHGEDRTNLIGAVRSHVRKRVVDVFRSYRARQGAQVKPRTVRQNRFGRALPDEEHRAVLGHLVDEAGYSSPLPGHGYLLRRLAERCAKEFDRPVPYYLERLPAILHTVKSVCSAGHRVNIGTRTAPEYVSWYDAYIDRPLGRRPDANTQPLNDDNAWASPAPEHAGDSDAVVVDLIVTAVASAPSDTQPQALRTAVLDLADRGLVPRRRAASLLADQTRFDGVLAEAREVITRV
ncbi:hypothetical protein DFR72_10982 [Lentzea flaviverrucosa]|uniref:Uncharacterized protein n=1 Tax=Lentzea flaviverrucosa TaxID=200379 RepID=A0A1H9CBD4_9PSEU|nr:hypothetical protein DFR72_10982 [Lentzea flaviverrucosa]SEP98540.1 hypothetical protein SAMN05216195_101737 [Lentzea flaviverrucosa]